MAGPFTHMTIVEDAIKSFSVDGSLGKMLNVFSRQQCMD
jgi:hypothetical protein